MSLTLDSWNGRAGVWRVFQQETEKDILCFLWSKRNFRSALFCNVQRAQRPIWLLIRSDFVTLFSFLICLFLLLSFYPYLFLSSCVNSSLPSCLHPYTFLPFLTILLFSFQFSYCLLCFQSLLTPSLYFCNFYYFVPPSFLPPVHL